MGTRVPFGIMILSALNGLAGVLVLVLALFSGIFIGVFNEVTHSIASTFWLFTLGSIVIAVLVVIGVSSLLIAWGLWQGKRWAWWLSLIVSAIGFVVSICTLSIVSLLIDAVILIYLLKLTTQLHFSVEFPWSW